MEYIEKPVSDDELRIITVIKDAWEDVTLKRNNTMSALQYLKVNNSEEIDQYVLLKYLQDALKKSIKYSKKQPITYEDVREPKKAVSKRDLIDLIILIAILIAIAIRYMSSFC